MRERKSLSEPAERKREL